MNTEHLSHEPKRPHVFWGLLFPFLEFVLGGILLALLVSHIQERNLHDQQQDADINCMTYADRIQNDLQSDISITDSLEQIIISENGRCDNFYAIARNLNRDSIESIQLAPSGIVSHLYESERPGSSTETLLSSSETEGDMDDAAAFSSKEETQAPSLQKDEVSASANAASEEEPSLDEGALEDATESRQNPYAVYAREHDITTLEGPVQLADGHQGLIARNPVFLSQNGQRTFWGFTIVVIRVPDVFSSSLHSLEYFGYQYRLLTLPMG